MYTSFYQLTEKPFQISSDPRFLWLGEKHKEALATLKYGILDNKGFLLLTGDVGTGKTTLIHSLIESLSKDVIFASVPDPSLDKLDFLNYIAGEFGIDETFVSKGAFLVKFRKFLINAHAENKKVLLIIDEAQLLSQELLEEIRLLSNIEKVHAKLINIFFVGQNEFNDTLNQVQNRPVRQRLTLNYNIDPLTLEETAGYIQFRLKVAGTDRQLFDPSAVQAIFAHSGGFPRRINILCDHALLSGYVQDRQTIGADVIKDCAKDLQIPVYTGYRSIPQPQASDPPAPQSSVIVRSAQMPPEEHHVLRNMGVGVTVLVLLGLLLFWLIFPDPFDNAVIQPTQQEQGRAFVSPSEQAVESPPAVPPLPAGTDSTVPAQPGKPLSAPVIQPELQETLPMPEAPPPLPTEKIVVRFKYNTNEFSEDGIKILQAFADTLSHYPDAMVRIVGYSDSAGYQKYNEKLSEFRANIVRSFLLGRGARPEQLETQGLGSANPVESNATPWGRMMNRRVEIEVTP